MSKILIIGNAVMDQIMRLPSYPHQDDECRASDYTCEIGGNACNSAQILAQLGHEVTFMGTLGDDPVALQIREFLQQKRIDSRLCVCKKGYRTPTSSIWLSQHDGSRTIVHFRDLPELSIDDLKCIDLDAYDWVHFEGRNIDNLIAYFNSQPKSPGNRHLKLSLEIEKPRNNIENLLPYMNVCIVSSQYLKASAMNPEQCLNHLRKSSPSIDFAITRGAQAVIGCNGNDTLISTATITVGNVVDTIGAGDCFIAGWIDASLRKQNFTASLESANKLAAYKIQHRGMTIEGYQTTDL